MPNPMSLFASPLLSQTLLSLAAFASLCLATRRHADQLGVNPQRWQMPLRIVGWGLLAVALWIAISHEGWSLGLTAWFGALTLSAFVVVLAASYRPRWLWYLALVGIVGGPFSLLA